ncbi:whey acidic protein-like [Paramacrobiotus metropolitanus]|uniref:whey acidic protein-like n=1 Tax=Paramacrobiotus metropolitanus TaxID=2943436 RepID=UPI00244615D6|nr:whey acidic protein-like [Paramacrobiotus metropolitanus]
MNSIVCVCLVLAVASLSAAIVLPEGFQFPNVCEGVRCRQEGYQCVQHMNPSIFCTVGTPCPRIPKCVRVPKSGLCPRLVDMPMGTCAQMCGGDHHCLDDQKCCSNGCGMQCVDPLWL